MTKVGTSKERVNPLCINESGMVHCTYQGVKGQNFQIKLYFSLVLANCTNPDEMQLSTSFHLGIHCLPKYMFRVSSI